MQIQLERRGGEREKDNGGIEKGQKKKQEGCVKRKISRDDKIVFGGTKTKKNIQKNSKLCKSAIAPQFDADRL